MGLMPYQLEGLTPKELEALLRYADAKRQEFSKKH